MAARHLVGFDCEINGERDCFRFAWNVAGEHQRRAEFAERARE